MIQIEKTKRNEKRKFEMRKLLMSLLMAGSLLASGVGAALADDASAPLRSASDERVSAIFVRRSGCSWD